MRELCQLGTGGQAQLFKAWSPFIWLLRIWAEGL
jgi:hypothetical protein